MFERLRQKWIEWLFAIILVVLTTILTNYATVRRDVRTGLRTKMDEKADKTYVDQQDESLRVSITEGDNNIKDYFDQYKDQQLQWQQSQDAKLNILLSRTR